ncbi:MAG: leucine-rich repeat protein, partial [Bacilli bacterium]|nr:leucine-rich repeat protein [Bacilli bacterium]
MKRKLLQIFVAILGFTLVGCDFLITTNSVQTTGTTFTVSFETNGGDLIEPVSVNSGSFYTMPTPVREGYVFESWYMDINMTAQYTAMTMLEEDITLYAGWTVGHYTLLFDDSGDDGLISIIQEFGVALETPDDPTKSGYTFGGWYSDSELTTPYVFTTMPAYDFTVYTKWISNQYSISFNTNGGNSISTITQDFGTIVTVSNPSKDSYIFDGWYLDSELTEPYTITTMPNENITVFAKWSHILYSISFNTNGGSDVTTITQEFGTVVVAPEEPTKFGYYSFNGWYLDSELSTLYTFTTMPNENIILYASWSESLTEDDPSNFSFTLKDDGTYEVSAYLGSNTEVVIPFFYLGKAVTSIGYTAFYGFSNITSIMIPMGVTYIDDYAFSGCSSLTNIAIPSSLTIIGAYAFYGCSSLTSITIPSGVIGIGNEAFSYCSSLTSITVPMSVTNIGAFAFRGCGDLVSMILPFVGVSRNASGISALFGYLFGTTSYAGAVETKQYYSNSQFETFYIPSKLHTITITDASKIQFGAFYNCSNLTNIAVPMTVTSIGASAFFGCTSLTRFVIPTSVSSISNYVFSGCSNITTISIPTGVTNIGTSAFNGCIKLSSIFIPESVTSIGSSAFALCSNITSISIPSGVTIIGSSAFSGCSSLTSITIPMGVTIINASTFAGCVNLTSIAIPTVVTSIGASAFSGCISLSTITIPIGVIYIGSQAFMGCSGITSITIPVGVTSFGDSVFSGCINLASITVDKDNQYYLSENSVMFDKQKTILIAYPAKKSD